MQQWRQSPDRPRPLTREPRLFGLCQATAELRLLFARPPARPHLVFSAALSSWSIAPTRPGASPVYAADMGSDAADADWAPSFKDLVSAPHRALQTYEKFISRNASQVSQIESTLRSLTYIIPGTPTRRFALGPDRRPRGAVQKRR